MKAQRQQPQRPRPSLDALEIQDYPYKALGRKATLLIVCIIARFVSSARDDQFFLRLFAAVAVAAAMAPTVSRTPGSADFQL